MDTAAGITAIRRRMIELVRHPLPAEQLREQLLAWQQQLTDLLVQPLPEHQKQQVAHSLEELRRLERNPPSERVVFQDQLCAAVSQL